MRQVVPILFCVLLGACGKAPDPLHAVSGKIMFDAKPLHKGDVNFVPDAAKGNTHLQFGIGRIGSDGRYVAKTFQQEGVKPGWYKVVVLATENEPQESLSWKPIWIIPEKYTKPETTPLSVEVVATAPAGTYDFTLERD